ncbi:PAAR repeat-containing protein [Caballeronia peredens]|nr:PAAR repeat-containing protein [Caballeronia peredens]
MTDRLVAKGDWTTTRGRVLGGSSSFYAENGQTLTRRTDLATCGKCKGAFPIYGTADTILDEGQPLVRHMDRVLCPCRQNFVLSGHPEFLIREGDARSTSDSLANEQTAAPGNNDVKYTSWFYVRDSVTGAPLLDQSFIVYVDGIKQLGKTDSNGYAKIETDGEKSVEMHVTFLSPKRDLNPA